MAVGGCRVCCSHVPILVYFTLQSLIAVYLNHADLHIGQLTLESFSKGDVAAFTDIYNRYYPDLYFLSRGIVGDLAPDIVADVFVQLWSQKKRFDSGEHLLFYLRAMTRNACYDSLKKEQRASLQLKELSYITDQEHEVVYFREIIEARLFSLILLEIDRLPPHMREVFRLSYIDGLKNAEIAELLNIKDASVRVRKAEALKLLRLTFRNTDLIVLLLLICAPD